MGMDRFLEYPTGTPSCADSERMRRGPSLCLPATGSGTFSRVHWCWASPHCSHGAVRRRGHTHQCSRVSVRLHREEPFCRGPGVRPPARRLENLAPARLTALASSGTGVLGEADPLGAEGRAASISRWNSELISRSRVTVVEARNHLREDGALCGAAPSPPPGHMGVREEAGVRTSLSRGIRRCKARRTLLFIRDYPAFCRVWLICR